ncbi:MAG: hypothetical protein ACYDIE_06470 [Candidatus Krumholzibacteriia bacterium]
MDGTVDRVRVVAAGFLPQQPLSWAVLATMMVMLLAYQLLRRRFDLKPIWAVGGYLAVFPVVQLIAARTVHSRDVVPVYALILSVALGVVVMWFSMRRRGS